MAKFRIDLETRSAVARLFDEIRKDLTFFGVCGAIVAMLTVWQPRLRALGIVPNQKWAETLFSDFVSFNAFGFIFFGYLLLACVATIFGDLGLKLLWLERARVHVEIRLAQIGSAIVCFVLGMLCFIVVPSFANLDASGVKLATKLVIFIVEVVATFWIAFLVGNRVRPFNRWWTSLILIGIVLWVIRHYFVK